jgi:cysteine desulfurase
VAPIYLDHHSTTPCEPAVVEAMLPWFTARPGNAASRTHTFGLEARAAVEQARAEVAALIGASPKEIVWTSGATEADNLAVLGVAMHRGAGHVVVSAVEHKAVLDPAAHLRGFGFQVTVVPPDADGIVDPERIRAALRDDTILVSLMLANNEVGTVQPVGEVGAETRRRGIPLHVDATQAPGWLDLDVVRDHVDLMALSAHKMYGPKGIGALYVRRGRPRVRLEPLFHGGGHERGHRSGTLPVPLIVGMGKAAVLADEAHEGGTPERVGALRDRLLHGLQTRIDGVILNGSPTRRLPHNLNVSFDRVEAEALMMNLRGTVAVSSGSACSSATLEPSYVLRALGVPDALAWASVRFGLGRHTTADEIDTVVDAFAEQVAALRALSPVHG